MGAEKVSIFCVHFLIISLQRLREVSYPTGIVEQFKYDNVGNRALKKYGNAEEFKTGNYLEERYYYDNQNRLLERKNPQNVTYYQYDKQGNTVSELTKRFLKPETTKSQNGNIIAISNGFAKTELEQYKTYEYNVFNQTSKVIVEDYQDNSKEPHVQENFYDAENLRYGIEENKVRINFVTNGWSVFTELDAEWKPTKRLVRGYGIVASEENLDNGDYHYYHQNEHGDIEYITGKDGKAQNAYTYDVFGNITNSTEFVKNRYTYNGEQYDTTTSQYYLRARYYNPLVGRFTQEDVYRGDGLNLYAYCGNNPVMYVDPSGYSSKCDNDSESDKVDVIYGSDDIANYQYNMIENPGPLAEMPNQPAKNFFGGRYNMEVLQEDRIMYRAGNSQNPYGRWFTSEPPASVANVRIDTAVKTHWINPKTGAWEASSYIDNVYAIKIPKGTTVYTGPVGPQGGSYVGGYDIMQTYIDSPWTFEVVGKTYLK